jgi:acetoin utilization deacetylase AcuC-like enzyme
MIKIITDSRCTEYVSPGHPERPQRISRTVEELREQKELAIEWLAPIEVSEKTLLLAHSAEHLASVKAAVSDFDADTPAHPNIYDHALRSVGGALHALKVGREGQIVFSLLRPPGHHATREHAMGFCYLNNVAIAALEALQTGSKKVAVFDFDVHHGNGTEAILLDKPGAAYFSVHQYPAYPGTGSESVKNAYNYPVAPGASREAYRAALAQAMEAIKKFEPDLLAVSAGFDAYRRDPLSEAALEREDFRWIGEWVRKLGVKSFSLLEGGYSSDLPELILAYLRGLAGVGGTVAEK